MAPFASGRHGSRGSNQFVRRGAGRGRGSGGARGRGSTTAKKGDRSTFFSTRIEEKVDDDAGPSEDARFSLDEEQVSDASNLSSSDEDAINEPLTTHSTESYNTLLQSFNAGQQPGPPQRKKRKTEGNFSNEPTTFESHEQQLEKQHDSEAIERNGIDDPSDVDESNALGEIEEEAENATEDSKQWDSRQFKQA